MALSFRRRSRGDFTMDDLALGLIGPGPSHEPRLSADEAATMLAASVSAEQSASVMQFVRPRDRRRVIGLAAGRRDRSEQNLLRAQWQDRPLPFDEGL